MTGPGGRARVIACATVIEELRPLLPAAIEPMLPAAIEPMLPAAIEPMLPAAIEPKVLDFGLHTRPAELRAVLQAEIDASTDVDVVLLGYGMCSRAVIGVRARQVPLVMPRVHDCIAIFLGSHRAYADQNRREPGTYYLTGGWIAVGDSPFAQVRRLSDRHGPQRARRMVDLMLRHYTRLAFIRTGTPRQEEFADDARRTAQEFGLRFEELDGAPDLIGKLVQGPWDEDIVVVEPGEVVTAEMFADPVGVS